MTERLVIYDSVFGNTEKIAKAIGEAVDAPIKKVTEVTQADLQGLELLIVGSPTRAFNPTPAIKNFLKGLKSDSLTKVKATAFDTRIALNDIDSDIFRWVIKTMGYADKKIAKMLVKKGVILALDTEGFAVKDSEGPLKDGELERAKNWVRTIL